MKNKVIIEAKSDLGLHIDGANLGPSLITSNIDNKIIIEKENCIKSTNPNDLKKNLKEVNNFNTKLYNTVIDILNNNKFPITIGGDHSIAIASSLASRNKCNIGIIWIDAHLDYNTFETTITGNLHGLPLAAVNGLAKDLTPFTNTFINPKNTVVVGYRAKEDNAKVEVDNILNAGGTIFTTDDIKKYGVKKVMEEAIKIASNNTDGIHISFDLDFIDPIDAPGVSVPEVDGIDKKTALEVIHYLNNTNNIKSFDIVEYNPLNDKENITLDIAKEILDYVINNI